MFARKEASKTTSTKSSPIFDTRLCENGGLVESSGKISEKPDGNPSVQVFLFAQHVDSRKKKRSQKVRLLPDSFVFEPMDGTFDLSFIGRTHDNPIEREAW
jgi:hypothetical protein